MRLLLARNFGNYVYRDTDPFVTGIVVTVLVICYRLLRRDRRRLRLLICGGTIIVNGLYARLKYKARLTIRRT